MKILYVSTISGTVNAFLVPHIEMLLKKGFNVDIACNITSPIKGTLLDYGCKIHNLEFQRSPLTKKNYTAYKKLKALIQEGNYTLVHTHTPVASFLTRLACRNIPNIKVLYTAHGFHFFKGGPWKNTLIYYPLERVLAKFTDGLITINQEDYNSAQRFKLKNRNSVYKTNGVGIDLNKFGTVLNPIEKSKLRLSYGRKENEFILFYAAELNSNKHQDLIINAINLLKDKIPNIRLLLAGNGSLRAKYEEEVKRLELQDYVIFLGYRKDIVQLLKISDIAVASSRREGLPVNIMEAMSIGLPLVVTKTRGHTDLVEDGKNGYIVEKGDVRGFAESIYKIFKSREIRKEFRVNNMEKVKQYSIKYVLNEMSTIYSYYLK